MIYLEDMHMSNILPLDKIMVFTEILPKYSEYLDSMGIDQIFNSRSRGTVGAISLTFTDLTDETLEETETEDIVWKSSIGWRMNCTYNEDSFYFLGYDKEEGGATYIPINTPTGY